MRRIPWLVCLVSLGLVGCTDGGDTNQGGPSGPLARSFSTGGDRVIVRRVHRPEGEAAGLTMKLRMSSDRATVYGPDLTPVGDVAWSGGESPEVRVRAIEDVGWTRLPVRNGIWEWPGRVRVEQTGRGWAVFGPEAEWVGRFYRTDAGEWRLEVDGRLIAVRESGSDWTVGHLTDEGAPLATPRWSVAYGELPHPVALSIALDDLSTIEQVAVGMAVEVQDPGAEASEGG